MQKRLMGISRQSRCTAQVPRRLCTCAQGQLHGVAGGPDDQLQGHAYSIPDRRFRSPFVLEDTNSAPAFRVDRGYCLDGLFVLDQLGR